MFENLSPEENDFLQFLGWLTLVRNSGGLENAAAVMARKGLPLDAGAWARSYADYETAHPLLSRLAHSIARGELTMKDGGKPCSE